MEFLKRLHVTRFLPFIFGLLWASTVSAQSGWSIKFAPLYGVEHTTNRYPDPPRAVTRTFFGLNVLAGVPLLSLELEGTQADDRREYPAENLKVEDRIQRFMVGLRSTVPATSWFAVFARAGGRGTLQKTTITNTTDNTKEVKTPPLSWDPYAGAGLQIAVGPLLAVSTGVTWIFVKDAPADVQYSLGFTLKFGQMGN